jgi:hypothetical protein
MKIITKSSLCFLIGILINCHAFADTVNVFRSSNFYFEYPSDWVIRQPQFPSAQAVVGPKSGEGAECSLTIKTLPGTASQADINTYLSEKPDAADYESSFRLQYNDVRVIETGNSMLGNLPAQVIRVLYSAGSSNNKVYVYSLAFSTATPSKSFTLTCAGSGNSQSLAEDNFNKWLLAFNKLIATFKII